MSRGKVVRNGSGILHTPAYGARAFLMMVLLAGFALLAANAVSGVSAHPDGTPVKSSPYAGAELIVIPVAAPYRQVMPDSGQDPDSARKSGQLQALGAPSNAPQALAWSALPGNGFLGCPYRAFVYAFAVTGTELYAGGNFLQTYDGSVANLGNIARLSGGAWTALPNHGLKGSVLALPQAGTICMLGVTLLRPSTARRPV